MEVIANELCTYSTRQFIEMFKKEGTIPLFGAPRGQIEGHFLPDDVSVEIVSRLLEFQTGGKVVEFLNLMVDAMDKRERKKNTVFCYGPKKCRKNFFFEHFMMNFYINRGQMKNMQKNQNFPFEDCVDRRIIMWNEPQSSESSTAIETLKMLFGGDDLTVQKKNIPDVCIKRTPVVVLTNNEFLWTKVEEFEPRFARFTWKVADFLKDVKAYPNPMMWPTVLEKYNIEF